MSWELFTVVQIAAFASAALLTVALRNRALRRQNDELLALCTTAHAAIGDLTGKLAALEERALPEQLLEERVKALVGDEPVTTVRRLVLENEISPSADFPDRLASHLTACSEAPEEAEFVRRWRAVREECQQLAMFLAADEPACHGPLSQIFEVLATVDAECGVSMAPLPPPAAATPADEPDAEITTEEPAADPAAAAAEEATAAATPPGAEPPTAAADDQREPGALDQAALDALLANAQAREQAEAAVANDPAEPDTGASPTPRPHPR